eukprot:g22917.t1
MAQFGIIINLLLLQVLIQLRVLHEIPSGTLQRFVVRAPEGIMFNEDPAKVSVLPKALPLRLAIPTQVAGDLLSLFLDEQSLVDRRSEKLVLRIGQKSTRLSTAQEIGTYNIRFEVSNPTVYPHDNTWSIFAMKDITVEFVHVLTGYYEGQASPFDINVATQAQTSAAGTPFRLQLLLTVVVVMAIFRIASVSPRSLMATQESVLLPEEDPEVELPVEPIQEPKLQLAPQLKKVVLPPRRQHEVKEFREEKVEEKEPQPTGRVRTQLLERGMIVAYKENLTTQDAMMGTVESVFAAINEVWILPDNGSANTIKCNISQVTFLGSWSKSLDIINSIDVPADLAELMGPEQLEQIQDLAKEVPCHLETLTEEALGLGAMAQLVFGPAPARDVKLAVEAVVTQVEGLDFPSLEQTTTAMGAMPTFAMPTVDPSVPVMMVPVWPTAYNQPMAYGETWNTETQQAIAYGETWNTETQPMAYGETWNTETQHKSLGELDFQAVPTSAFAESDEPEPTMEPVEPERGDDGSTSSPTPLPPWRTARELPPPPKRPTSVPSAAPTVRVKRFRKAHAAQEQFGLPRLPEPWIRVPSKSSGGKLYYYVNLSTGESTFESPDGALPPGWEVVISKSTGKLHGRKDQKMEVGNCPPQLEESAHGSLTWNASRSALRMRWRPIVPTRLARSWPFLSIRFFKAANFYPGSMKCHLFDFCTELEDDFAATGLVRRELLEDLMDEDDEDEPLTAVTGPVAELAIALPIVLINMSNYSGQMHG